MPSTPSREAIVPVSRRFSRRRILLGLGTLAALGGGIGGGVALWNYHYEHTAVYVYRGYSSDIQAVVWSPDGQRIACGGSLDDKLFASTTHIWDAFTGNHLLTHKDIRATPQMISDLSWSPDGTRIASVEGDTYVWDAHSGRALTFHHDPDVIQLAAAWSPDSTRLVSGGDFGNLTAKSWEATSGKILINYGNSAPDSGKGIFLLVSPGPLMDTGSQLLACLKAIP